MARRRDEFERLSIAQFLTRPFKVLWEWGTGLAASDQIRDRQTNPVVSILLAPLRFLVACLLFLVNSWATTRHIRPFLLSIPLLLVVTVVGGTVWLDYFRFPNKVAKTQKYYQNFLYDPDRGPKIAQHFALKKVALQPNDPSAKYDLATVWESLGSSQETLMDQEKFLAGYRAEDLMNSLAENDYSMAHVWLANRLLVSSQTNLSQEKNSEKNGQPSIEIEPIPELPPSPRSEEALKTAEAARSELALATKEREAVDAEIVSNLAKKDAEKQEVYFGEEYLDEMGVLYDERREAAMSVATLKREGSATDPSELDDAMKKLKAIDNEIAIRTPRMIEIKEDDKVNYLEKMGPLFAQRKAALKRQSQATETAVATQDALSKLGPELSKNPQAAARTVAALDALGNYENVSGTALAGLIGLCSDPAVAAALDAPVAARVHLERALVLDAENDVAKIRKADLFLLKALREVEGSADYKRLLSRAREQYVPLFDTNLNIIIGYLPRVMDVLVKLDEDPLGAKQQFQGIKKILYQHMRKFPGDENIPQIWGILITSAIQLKDYEGAEELIKGAQDYARAQRIPDGFGELKAMLLIRQVADLKDLESPEKFDAALDIFSEGIEESPNSRLISNRLIQFIFPDKDRDGKLFVEQLEKTKSNSAPVHLLKGIHKVMEGDALSGKTHWKVAEEQSPKTPFILVTMISSLMNEFNEQFENRRDVMALAIEQFPNEWQFYLLRGSDLYNQGNYADAVLDLEQAAQMNPKGSFEVHFQLARCYKALKDQDKFDVQRRKLQTMIQPLEPKQRQILEDNLNKLDED
jgi:tetratricopeptide (TPR) repeat protein